MQIFKSLYFYVVLNKKSNKKINCFPLRIKSLNNYKNFIPKIGLKNGKKNNF
jgi:hypothetical protein